MSSWHWRRLVAPALLTCILLYAALLRLDALFKTYGPYDEPRWLAVMEPLVRSAASTLTPDWPRRRVAEPYVGGDPVNYLKFAREMRSFYAAHVREPMFPAVVKGGLLLAGGSDVGVSVTSIAFALLTLVATYALGAQLASPAVGLAAAAALAIDRSAVHWAIGGWRDELFAFFAVSCAWAWIRFARRPSSANAAIAGVLSAGACLTRITSITLIAPAIIWLLATRALPVRRQLVVAVGLMTVLVAPFLINCAIATGDPLYAINNHTDFYLKREAAEDQSGVGAVDEAVVRPISAIDYSWNKFEARPIAAADTAAIGLFVYPFRNKWVGLDDWFPGLGSVSACLAIVGTLSWLWLPEGRMLLAMFVGALVPFSMTWTVRGGAEWRLTLFAYTFYLVAAFWLVERVVRALRAALRRRGSTDVARPPAAGGFTRSALGLAAVVAGVMVFAGVWAFAVPYAVVREALAQGAPATISVGSRNRWFFADGWTHVIVSGNVTTRIASQPSSTLRIVLPHQRPYSLVLRMDPLVPLRDPPQRVQVSLNDDHLGDLELTWNPERIGAYRLSIPAAIFTPGAQRLVFRSDSDLKFWYVRMEPREAAWSGAEGALP